MWRRCCLLLVGALALVTGAKANDQTQLIVWGENYGPDTKGMEARVRAFEKLNPDIKVRPLNLGAGGMNPQKLMTAIVGEVPPDVIAQDRFTISDWAARGAFMPLDEFIKRDAADPLCPRASDYYPAAWAEARYDNKQYGIPVGADDRVLYYNTKFFAENANKLRAAGCDPTRPPRTWSELLKYAEVLTIKNPDGSLKRAGFIPNYGNSWLYLYAFQENAKFLSDDGHTCTLNSPETQDALKFMVQGYDMLGGFDEAEKFNKGFGGGEADPFISGKVAMMIHGDWQITDLARYGPNLEFKTAPAPVPDDRYYKRGRFANEKDTYITWIGGFSYAIPAGSKHSEAAWRYIKYMAGDDAYRTEYIAQAEWNKRQGRPNVPRIMAKKSRNEINMREFPPADPRYAGALKSHIDMMPFARIRPATPVGQRLWDEHVRAYEQACRKNKSVEEALENSQKVVQKEIDEVYAGEKLTQVNMALPAVLGLITAIVGTGLFVAFFKRQRLGVLGKNEAKWAYLFLAPWLFGFFVFTLGPMVASLFFSFTQYNILTPARWVGLQNYAEVANDEQHLLGKAFMNILYVGGIGVPLGLVTGLAIALLLNQAVRGMRFFRTAFYLPTIVPGVASAILWMFITNADPNKGLINSYWGHTIQQWFGFPMPGWLAVETWAKPTIIMMGVWGAGGGMVLWLAGLKAIPTTLYEAASIDGASPWRQFVSVTLPQLSPIVFFNTVMGFIGAVQTFDNVYVMTGGQSYGPADSLLTPVYLLFKNAFTYFKMGYSSALAWLIFVVILALTAIQFVLAPRWVHYEVEK